MGTASLKAKTSAGKLFGVNRIYGADGEHETVYMTRAWFGRLRFHIFHRGDADPDCHDHPWGFWTFPLRSYVEEVLDERQERVFRIRDGRMVRDDRTYYERRIQVVRAFRLHYRPATHRHRVLGAYGGVSIPLDPHNPVPAYHAIGAIPTIVWREAPSRPWGFVKERLGKWCWTPWQDYVFNGGKSAPCEDQE